MRCAVVGHVEWVEFARVPRLPAAGTIVHAAESWTDPAGAGPVMAHQLALLAGRCEFFTVLGDDELGRRSERRLAELGIDVHAEYRASTRRARHRPGPPSSPQRARWCPPRAAAAPVRTPPTRHDPRPRISRFGTLPRFNG